MADMASWLHEQGSPGGAARVLGQLTGLNVYPSSLVADGDTLFFLGRQGMARKLGILCATPQTAFDMPLTRCTLDARTLLWGVADTSHAHAVALRSRLPFTAPVAVGVRKSAGLGDRLGVATPGHVRALRRMPGLVPVLAQQSIREMERSDRTHADVLDDAMWGVFQEGWREGYGADADHLKTEADIDSGMAQGFVTYTLDPRDQVDNAADADPLATLEHKFWSLPWDMLLSTPQETSKAYVDRAWNLGAGESISLSAEQLLRAACKYGPALAHIRRLFLHLCGASAGRPFELEISVDETDTPTRPEEHLYIASELRRLGVPWISLAPRFVGRFEKGVDYIGDLGVFENEFRRHVAIARALGPYKLSLHSGSDKFSIYPIVARLAGELVHLKTAGTWYLEALRAVAQVDAGLYRRILQTARAHYERDRASYYVSARGERLPEPDTLADSDLRDTLDLFDVRQALHVTFGTVLTERDQGGQLFLRNRLFAALQANEEAHYAALEAHVCKHLQPFAVSR